MNIDEGNLHLEILRVAHDIYERSGRIKERDLNNWLEAVLIRRKMAELQKDNPLVCFNKVKGVMRANTSIVSKQ
jgi:hypothetical protein